MCEFAKCCCCVDLRLGAILIALFNIIFGILVILRSFSHNTHVNFIDSNHTRILNMEDSDKDNIWMKCMELENITALASVAAGVFLQHFLQNPPKDRSPITPGVWLPPSKAAVRAGLNQRMGYL